MTVEYSLSGGLGARLARLGCSLAFTSYQSNLLYMLGVQPDGGVHLHQSAMVKPMGLAHDGRGGLALACDHQLIRLVNVLRPQERVKQIFDACFVPRTIHLIGQLDAHDVGVDADDRPIFVNTRFNCLATICEQHSFKALWRPPFISALVGEDRCHLNGLAMEDGRPAYVTAVSRSDVIDGWRDRRADGGVLIDVREDRIVCEGLSMPHSPRLHRGELWLLNAGSGELGLVRSRTGGAGRFEPLVFCPGFLRGLAFHGNLAFVGLSKPRHRRFEGLALDQRLAAADAEPWCGVQVIDLDQRCCVDWMRIDGDVGELFDVAVLPTLRCPMTVSPSSLEAAQLITIESQSTDGAGRAAATL